MTIKAPDYQLRLPLDLQDNEQVGGNLSAEDVRIRLETARARLENGESWQKKDGKPLPPTWLQEFYRLLDGGWDFRVAVYIAWAATPKKYRWPENQEKLAIEVLGLTSDRQISTWRTKNPAIDAMVKDVSAARVLDRLSDSIDAMLEVAAQPNYKGRGDRELHFRMADMLQNSMEIVDRRGLPDLSKLPWQDKLALAKLKNPEDIEAFRLELAERYRREQQMGLAGGEAVSLPADDATAPDSETEAAE